MTGFLRTFALDDIQIRSGGDGRTVEAYAAVFDTPVPIRDQQGEYDEQIARTAFNKTLADNGTRFGVFYNHGTTILGTPSDRASIPLGTPEEIRPDGRGLLTVTRYNRTPLADEVLESIRNGDIRGQSFSGRFVASTPAPPKGGMYRPGRDGSRTLVTRTEIALREYGPTPFPAYADAAILGVRTIGEDSVYPPTPRQVALATALEGVAETFGQFDQSSGPDGAHYMTDNPFAASGMACANCYFYDGARSCELVAGDIAPDSVCKFWIIPAALLTSGEPASPTASGQPGRSDTPADPGAVAEEPRPREAGAQHSGRLTPQQRARIALLTLRKGDQQ